MLNMQRKDALVLLCQDFVRCPSVSGHERKLASFLEESMYSLGFDEVKVDYFGNVLGKMSFGKGGKNLLFEAQMDHVEVRDPSEWQYYPYGAFLADESIYGRGTTDQKGSLAAMILAASMLKHDLGDNLCGNLAVAATVHQERFEGVSSRLVGSAYEPDYVVIGEASDLQIERGQRGRAEIVLENQGKMAHSAHPDYGINAALKMISLVKFIRENFTPGYDPFLGKGILELTNITSFPRNNAGTIPDRCRVVFDRRLLLGDTRSNVIGDIEKLVALAKLSIPDLDASVHISRVEDHCYTGVPIKGEHYVPAWLFPEDHEFIRSSLRGLKQAGLPARLSSKAGFGTNGCYYGGVAGIPSIVFGPSSEDLAHITDEHIKIEQLVKGCEGYYGIGRGVLAS